MALLLDRIPLVDHHYQTLVVALDQLENVHVLAFDTTGGIEEQNADIGVFDGTNGAHHAVKLQIFGHFVLLADTGCVDEVEVETELVVFRENRVAGGAGDICDNVAVFADEGIDERAFAGIGAANDRKAGNIGIAFVNAVGGHLFENEIEQVAGTAARGGGDAIGFAQAEGVEFCRTVAVFVLVGLVGAQNDRRFGTAQDVGHLRVEVGDAVLHIDDEKNKVCFFGGEGYLFADLFFEDVIGVYDPAAGIYKRKLTRPPFALAVLAVARCACLVADNGLAGSGESIEECGLPDIGASHYGY